MNTGVISVRTDVTLDVVSRYLRQLGHIPEQTADLMAIFLTSWVIGRFEEALAGAFIPIMLKRMGLPRPSPEVFF